MAAVGEFDAIRASLRWTKIRAIADEIAGTVVKTAVSTSIGVSEDFASSILDSRGRLMACGARSVAQFSALLPRTMRIVLEEVPVEDWFPGDVVIATDPWVTAGHHFDLVLVTPAFHEERLIGFVVSLGHTSDVGGMLAISGAKDMYEEGLVMPVVKMYNKGVPNRDVVRIFRANIRVPDIMMGDLHAMTAANELGARRLSEMASEDGLHDFIALTDELENYTEDAVRRAIAEVPDGIYEYGMEVDGISKPVHVQIAITVAGDSLKVDFSGSASQDASQAVNAVFNFTLSETATAVQTVLTPTTPFNEGFLRAVEIYAPEGSIFNCTKPMPVKNRDKVISHIETLIFSALHPVLPDRVLAGSGAANVTIITGRDKQTGKPFNAYISLGAGHGAGAGYDGPNAVHFPYFSRNIPVEVVETRSPLFFLSKTICQDSGGPGEFRGGCGQEVVFRVADGHEDPVALGLCSDNVRFAEEGLAGGEAGTTCGYVYNGTAMGADSQLVVGSFTFLNPGDELAIRLSGGGGFGNAIQRDAEAVAQDVKLGFVSAQAAEDRYGVIIDPVTGAVDRSGTERVRAARSDLDPPQS